MKNDELNNNEYKYKAFISYRHGKDSGSEKIASKLQSLLESYRLPDKTHWKICKDREDFESNNDLTEEIRSKLRQSEYLIVLLSPAYPESVWCNLELDYFKNTLHHGSTNKIITFIVEGSIEEVTPDVLRSSVEKDEKIDPFSIVVCREGKKASVRMLKKEYLRAVAKMLGVDYRVISGYEQKRKAKKLAVIFSAAILLLTVFLITVTSFLISLYQKNREIQAEQSEGLCRESQLLWESGKTYEALAAACKAVDGKDDGCYSVSAVDILAEETGAFNINNLGFSGKVSRKYPIRTAVFVNGGKDVFLLDRGGFGFWDSKTGEAEKIYSGRDLNLSEYYGCFLLDSSDDRILLGDGSVIISVDCVTKEIMWQIKGTARHTVLCSDKKSYAFADTFTDSVIIIDAESGKTLDEISIKDLFPLNKTDDPQILSYNSETGECVFFLETMSDSSLLICSKDGTAHNTIDLDFENRYSGYSVSRTTIGDNQHDVLVFTAFLSEKNKNYCIDPDTGSLLWQNEISAVGNSRSFCGIMSVGEPVFYCTGGDNLNIYAAESGQELFSKSFTEKITGCSADGQSLRIYMNGALILLTIDSAEEFRFAQFIETPPGTGYAAIMNDQLAVISENDLYLYEKKSNPDFVRFTCPDENKTGSAQMNPYGEGYFLNISPDTYYCNDQQKIKLNTDDHPVSAEFIGKSSFVVFTREKKELLLYDTETLSVISEQTIRMDDPLTMTVSNGYIIIRDLTETEIYTPELKELSPEMIAKVLDGEHYSFGVIDDQTLGILTKESLSVYSITNGEKINEFTFSDTDESQPMVFFYFSEPDLAVLVCSDDTVLYCRSYLKKVTGKQGILFESTELSGINSNKFAERSIYANYLPDKQAIVFTSGGGTVECIGYVTDIGSMEQLFLIHNYKGYSANRGFYVCETMNSSNSSVFIEGNSPVYGFFPFYSLDDLIERAPTVPD